MGSPNVAPAVNYRLEYIADDLRYLGEAKLGIDDDDPRWIIYRFTWSGGNLVHIEQKGGVAWADRATIF